MTSCVEVGALLTSNALALQSQSVVRGHQVRTWIKGVRRMREVHRRVRAAGMIQYNWRAKMAREQHRRDVALMKRAVRFIEERMREKKFWRAIQYVSCMHARTISLLSLGLTLPLYRAKLAMHDAARRIQKFVRQVVAQFRWGIIRAKIKARRYARKRRAAMRLLVRIARGFLGRIRCVCCVSCVTRSFANREPLLRGTGFGDTRQSGFAETKRPALFNMRLVCCWHEQCTSVCDTPPCSARTTTGRHCSFSA